MLHKYFNKQVINLRDTPGKLNKKSQEPGKIPNQLKSGTLAQNSTPNNISKIPRNPRFAWDFKGFPIYCPALNSEPVHQKFSWFGMFSIGQTLSFLNYKKDTSRPTINTVKIMQ